MAKFRNFISPIKYISEHIKFVRDARRFYFRVNTLDNKLTSPTTYNKIDFLDNLLGGFHPFMEIGKDIIDTVKPYKSKFYIARDALQPIRGIGNTLKGIFNIVTSPILMGIDTINNCYTSIRYGNFDYLKRKMSFDAQRHLGGFIDGIGSTIRGISQIATTPLTWFVRMPLRGIITAVRGMPTIQQSLQSSAKKLKKTIKSNSVKYNENQTIERTTTGTEAIKMDRGIEALYSKVLKQNERGQKPGIEIEEVNNKFNSRNRFLVQKNTTSHMRETQGIYDGPPLNDDQRYLRWYDNSEQTKQKALEFLSLFTRKKKTIANPVDTNASSVRLLINN